MSVKGLQCDKKRWRGMLLDKHFCATTITGRLQKYGVTWDRTGMSVSLTNDVILTIVY